MEASKKRRRQSGNGTDDDEPSLDLLSLYQSDFGDRILSFGLVLICVHLIYQQAIQEINY